MTAIRRLNTPQGASPRVQAGGGPAKPAMRWIPSVNHNARPGGPGDLDTIVLHHTGGGSLESNIAWMNNPASKVSAHYTVGKDGRIVNSVRDQDRAWHAGVSRYQGRDDVNDFSVGIEIVNKGDHVDPYPPEQMEAVAHLVAWLMTTHGISFERVTGHRDVALPRGRKVDPSNNFDWQDLKNRVQRHLGNNPTSPGGPPASPPAAPVDQAPAPRPAPAPARPDGTITVRKGDTLWHLAQVHLGDAHRWRELYEANRDRLKDPNLILPGQVLRLPGATATPTPSPAPAPGQPAPAQPAPVPGQPAPVQPAPGGTILPVHPPAAPMPGRPYVPPVREIAPPPPAQPPQQAQPQPAPSPNPLPSPAPAPQPTPGTGVDRLGWALRGGTPLAGGLLSGGLGQNWGGAGTRLGSGLRVPGGLMGSALLAGLGATLSNVLDWRAGRISGRQALVGTAVDTAAYTGIAAASTWIGGLAGSILPGLGTVIGMAVGTVAGVGLSWLYEKFVRSRGVAMAGSATQGIGNDLVPRPATVGIIPSTGTVSTTAAPAAPRPSFDSSSLIPQAR
ncbi:MAG: N-acetylmuramoyl-L-alanine amidase [Candidatus Sericytochromatia bacterium]|nr:N-acetylmuramoyl-L-alanine amidase [Candidatus Sericytochromatia bacterium]